jgi:hypothetical protein
VIDAEFAALLGDPVVGGGPAAVEALGVARVQARQNRPADVVEDRGQGQLVAVADAAQLGDPVRGALDGQSVQSEAIGGEGQSPVAIEEVVGGRGAKDRLDSAWAESLDPIGDTVDSPGALDLTGGSDDRGRETDISLDDGRDLVRRRAPGYLLESLFTALLQGRLALCLVECGGQDAPAALATGAVLRGSRRGGCGCHA